MARYDYIFSGFGLSGFMIIKEMLKYNNFINKTFLIIEPDTKDTNDRTWCFWEKELGQWDNLVQKSWDSFYFITPGIKKKCDLEDFKYKMIKSKKFYESLKQEIQNNPNIHWINDTVTQIKQHTKQVVVTTTQNEYIGNYCLNSVITLYSNNYNKKYPLLNQHFIGWWIESEEAVFDSQSAVFMDFSVAQKQNTRFMYVLPETSNKALVEYTLFSANLLQDHEYENEIKIYLKKIGVKNYKIIEKEKGCIPMTGYPFWKNNSKNIINIGTAGGWTKASTGFTFKNSEKKAQSLVSFLKTEKIDLTQWHKKTRFYYYDILFIDVLYNGNHLGKKLFCNLFSKIKPTIILGFLEESSTLKQEFNIINACPKKPFIKALIKRLYFWQI